MKGIDKNDFIIDDVFKMIDKKIKKKNKSDSIKCNNETKKESNDEYYEICI